MHRDPALARTSHADDTRIRLY